MNPAAIVLSTRLAIRGVVGDIRLVGPLMVFDATTNFGYGR
jgi:hypothetical protein